MSDELELLPSRRVEVPARFIREAYEHLQSTNDRYATLLFVGLTNDEHITCVGVSTRRLLTGDADFRHAASIPPIEMPETPSDGVWTMETLTDDVVLPLATQHGSVTTKMVGDMLGIPSDVINLRQKIRRILERLVKQKKLRQSGNNFTVPNKQPRMSVRPPSASTRRKLTRGDITDERVIGIMQQMGVPVSSRTISDMLQIPRSDNTVRSKTTLILRALMDDGQVRRLDASGEGGILYELTRQPAAARAE